MVHMICSTNITQLLYVSWERLEKKNFTALLGDRYRTVSSMDSWIWSPDHLIDLSSEESVGHDDHLSESGTVNGEQRYTSQLARTMWDIEPVAISLLLGLDLVLVLLLLQPNKGQHEQIRFLHNDCEIVWLVGARRFPRTLCQNIILTHLNTSSWRIWVRW